MSSGAINKLDENFIAMMSCDSGEEYGAWDQNAQIVRYASDDSDAECEMSESTLNTNDALMTLKRGKTLTEYDPTIQSENSVVKFFISPFVKEEPKREGGAGYDISALYDEVLKPCDTTKVPTGVHVIPPRGYYMKAKNRYNLASRNIIVTGGKIDSGYRGEIFVSLYNGRDESVDIHAGDRIAQLVPKLLNENLRQQYYIIDEEIAMRLKNFTT